MSYLFNPFTGTLDQVGAGSSTNSFSTIQPDLGTSPTAASSTDTLTITSDDGSVAITGNSSTKTIDLQASNLSTSTVFQNDFMGGGSPPADLTVNHTGTGAKSSIRAAASTNAHPGVWSLQSGTDTNGKAGMFGSDTDQVFTPVGGGQFIFETLVQVPTISDGTDTFTVLAGLSDDPYNGNIPPGTDGIWFSYTHGTNSGHWTFSTRQSGAETAIDTGIAVVAGTWYKLKFIINAAGSSIQSYIAGTAAGTPITTNIPTGKVMVGWLMKKSAGTNNREFYIDYFKAIKNFTAPR